MKPVVKRSRRRGGLKSSPKRNVSIRAQNILRAKMQLPIKVVWACMGIMNTNDLHYLTRERSLLDQKTTAAHAMGRSNTHSSVLTRAIYEPDDVEMYEIPDPYFLPLKLSRILRAQVYEKYDKDVEKLQKFMVEIGLRPKRYRLGSIAVSAPNSINGKKERCHILLLNT